MLLLFFTITHSLYVPINSTKRPYLDLSTLEEMNKVINIPGKKTIVFLVYPDDYNFYSTLAQFKALFKEDINFVTLDENSTQAIAQEHDFSIPIILVYENGNITKTFNPMATEQAIISFANTVLLDETNFISNQSELLQSIGNNLNTLIATKNTLKDAYKMQELVCDLYGMLEIVFTTDEVISSFGLQPDKLVLYRQQDSSLVNVESDLEDFRKKIKPLFGKFTSDRLSQIEGEIVLIIDPKMKEESGDVLYNIAENHPNFTFALCDFSGLEFVQYIVGERNPSFPYLLVYNLEKRYYYKFDQKYIKDAKYIDNFLKLIEEKQILPSYLSQPIPKQDKPYIEKVVGSNYAKFINDETKDVVMFYYSELDTRHTQFFNQFVDLAKTISEFKLPIKFGYIDLYSNASPLKYPVFIDFPHIHYFPSYDKKNDTEVYGEPNSENTLLMLNLSSKYEIPIERPHIDPNEINELYQRIFEMEDNLSPEHYQKAMNYFKVIHSIIGNVNFETSEVIEEPYNQETDEAGPDDKILNENNESGENEPEKINDEI